MNPDAFQLDDSISTPVLVGVVVLCVALLAFGVYLCCRVARKAGYSPWAGLLLFVPVVNLVVMLVFVFSEWPIEREVKALRQQRRSDAGQARFGTPPGYGTPSHGTPSYGAPGAGTATPTPRSGIAPDPFNAPPSQS